MSDYVFNASALFALPPNEAGAGCVRSVLDNASISAINLTDVVAHYARASAAQADIENILCSLSVEIVSTDAAVAFRAGMPRPTTDQVSLWLGDRIYLSTAKALNAVTVTTYQNRAKLVNPSLMTVKVIQ